MSLDINAPLYAAIYQDLIARIQNQENGYQHKLPSERDLMSEFGTTRVTLRIALSQLEREGVIYRSNRRGWFVTPEKLSFDPTSRFNFSSWVMQRGRVPSTELLSVEELCCENEQQGANLGLKKGDSIVKLSRRRSIDDRLVLLENIEMASDKLPGLMQHDLSGSLTAIFLDFYSIDMVREEVTINATALSREQAHLLSVADGSFCVAIERTRFNQHNEAIEHDQEWWLHNAIEINVNSELR